MTSATDAAQLGDAHLARVDVSDGHPAGGRVVEAREKVEQRRLAGARRPADRDDLSRLDYEVEFVQHVHLAAVREAHILEAHADRAGRKRSRIRRLGQRLDSVEPAEAAARGRKRPLREVEDPADRLERPHELQQQRLEEDELPDRQVAVNDGTAAEEDHCRDRERRQVVEAGHVLRLDARLAERRSADSLGPVAEAPAHVVLAPEGLHHLDPDDGLVRRLGHVALPGLHLPRDRRHEPPEAVGDEPDQRQRRRPRRA